MKKSTSAKKDARNASACAVLEDAPRRGKQLARQVSRGFSLHQQRAQAGGTLVRVSKERGATQTGGVMTK